MPAFQDRPRKTVAWRSTMGRWSMRLDHGVRYVGFCASAAALLWLAMAGIIPIPHPFHKGEYLIDTSAHPPRTMRNFFRRQDVVLALTFVFATAGAAPGLPRRLRPPSPHN